MDGIINALVSEKVIINRGFMKADESVNVVPCTGMTQPTLSVV